jgi:hypothetical protein
MRYAPSPVPFKADDPMVGYVYRELSSLSILLRQALVLEKKNAAPSKPEEGQIEFADGTNWNPGSGAGIYAYYASAWNKLG